MHRAIDGRREDVTAALTLLLGGAALGFVGALVAKGLCGDRRQPADDRHWFEMSNDLLAEVSLDGYFTRLSQPWESTLGWTREELMARPFREFVHPEDLAATNLHADPLERRPGEVSNFENRYLTKDGSWRWLLWSARSDRRRKYAVARDITERKELEQRQRALIDQLGTMAATDALTGLPNRRAWETSLASAIAQAQRDTQPLVVAIIDLDEFKQFNDRHGHGAGDAFLQEAAVAWRTIVRAGDFLARFGGEEFTVLLPGCEPDAAIALLERLRAATPGLQTCSVGVATWVAGESSEDLVARADAALYEAKHRGRDTLVVAESPISPVVPEMADPLVSPKDRVSLEDWVSLEDQVSPENRGLAELSRPAGGGGQCSATFGLTTLGRRVSGGCGRQICP